MKPDPSYSLNTNISVAKTFLIISVYIGHFSDVLASPTILAIIASFHMACFMAVSGFLIDIDKFASLSMEMFVKKYIKSILIPISVGEFVYRYIWHLHPHQFWYIYTLLFTLVLLKICLYYTKNILYIWIVFAMFFGMWFLVMVWNQNIFIDYLNLYYGLFFFIGVTYRSYSEIITYRAALWLCIGSWVFRVGEMYFGLYDEIIGKFFCSLFSSLYMLSWFRHGQAFPKNTLIEFIGHNTLPIYIYHWYIRMNPILYPHVINHIIFFGHYWGGFISCRKFRMLKLLSGLNDMRLVDQKMFFL